MKKIAFLSFDWNYEVMYGYYRGMERCVSQNSDVQLFIFNAFGKYASYEPEEGSFEIFNLCHPEDYDGFILQGNRVWPVEMRQALAKRIHKLGKPVISINYELDYAYFVGTDNEAGAYELVHTVLSEKDRKLIDKYMNRLKELTDKLDTLAF